MKSIKIKEITFYGEVLRSINLTKDIFLSEENNF